MNTDFLKRMIEQRNLLPRASSWHHVFILVLLVGVTALPLVARGQTTPLPSAQIGQPALTSTSTTGANQAAISETQTTLNVITEDTTIDPALKERLLSTYRSTLDALRSYATDTERIATFAKSAALAPEKLADARAKAKQPAKTFAGPANADRLPLEDLRQRRSEAEAELAGNRQIVQSLEGSQRERELRRVQLPKLIADARMSYETAQATPLPDVDEDPQGMLLAAREAERNAKLQSLRQNTESLTQELATIDAEAELLPALIEVARGNLTFAEQSLRFWSDQLSAQKQYRVENEIDEHEQSLLSDGIDDSASIVLRLKKQWIDVLREQSRWERKLTREQSRFAELNDTIKSTQAEIDRDIQAGRGLRSGLGLKLQMARERLPSSSGLSDEMSNVDSEIDTGRALQSMLEMTLENLRTGTNQGIGIGGELRLPMRDGVVDPNEVSLIKEMKADIDQQLNTLIDIKSELELKRSVVSNLRLLIEKHVIWIRNAAPFQLVDLKLAWDWFQWILMPNHPQMIGMAFWRGITSRVDLIFIWIIFCAGLLCFGARLRRRLYQAGEQAIENSVSANTTSPLRPTMIALVITTILAIPAVATLGVIGYAILSGSEKDVFVGSVGDAFLLAAVALFPMEALRQMLRPRGLATAHFGYRQETVAPARTSLRLLIDLGIPLLIIWRVANETGRSQMDSSLGRFIFAIGMVTLSFLLWQSLHHKTGLLSDYLNQYPDSWTTRLRRVWHPVLASLPAALAALSLFGYSYTATLFAGKLYWTLWLAIGVLVLGGIMRQWFMAYRQRVAVKLRQEKSVEMLQLEGSLVELPSNTSADMAEMNAQSLRLIQALMWLVAFVGIAIIWAPVFPAIGFLDAVPLWQNILNDGTVEKITLKNLVIFFPIVLLSFVAVRNIPGLLEGLLLERLPLDRPARYAITTLATYAFAIVGILISARTLGLRWDGIQWLVAALGVGLGFGLQEIFANFISGLILLFEQPIRVGDVVTIDGTTGTVSRIRMRATSVTNYDRQELIIPNKDLITGRLINWTLTDSTNRLVLNIGVAYGSDTRRACRLLEQICAQHDNLLVDPPPTVTFEGFGDSTLNVVVRCFLGALDKRLQTIHELNTTINERFAQEGIEIAFPQRDLHIRTWPSTLPTPLPTPMSDATASLKDTPPKDTPMQASPDII